MSRATLFALALIGSVILLIALLGNSDRSFGPVEVPAGMTVKRQMSVRGDPPPRRAGAWKPGQRPYSDGRRLPTSSAVPGAPGRGVAEAPSCTSARKSAPEISGRGTATLPSL